MKCLSAIIFIGLASITNTTLAQFQKVSVSNCAPPSAAVLIDINNVRARLMNGGDMWWNISTGGAAYEIPKGSNKFSMFTGAIWISGMDDGGNLHTAGQTYRQRGLDFWPGPLTNFGETDSLTCSTWDKMFVVKGTSIVNAINGVSIDASITDWPGTIAPYVDKDADGIYNPNNGDYPAYDPQILGNIPGQMVWWVINDVGGQHTAYTGGLPMGIEIQTTAFAYASAKSSAINNSTMYRYRIINKSSFPLYDVYVSEFLDPDLGDGNDDYVGCNLSASGHLFYCYNANTIDSKYGINPPAIGLTYIKEFKDDIGNKLPPSSFMFFTNEGIIGVNSDPTNAIELNRYLRGKWADGTNLIYGTSDGRGLGDSTNYAFTGNVYESTGWKETGSPGDRRMMPSTGPFSLLPGSFKEVAFAMVWAKSDTGGNKGSVAKLILSADSVRAAAATNFAAFTTGIEKQTEFKFNVYPNPVLNKCMVEIPTKNSKIITVKIFDIQGKIIFKQNFDPISKVEIDLSNFEHGTYLLQVNQGVQSSTQKIIKH